MCYKDVESKIKKLDLDRLPEYLHYFEKIRPKTAEDKFRRGLCAIATVHSTYESTVKLYASLWNLSWMGDSELLKKRIDASRAGLANNRTKFIMEYTALFWQFPDLFKHKDGEPWHVTRDRIMAHVKGLGISKSAFFLELLYPKECRVVCMDVHMLRLYGVQDAQIAKVTKADMVRMETHWDMACRHLDINPVATRWLFWDTQQGKKDSRYWAWILEGEPKIQIDPQLELFKDDAA